MVAQFSEYPTYSSSLQVVRRNNNKAPFDAQRIRDVINWACQGITSQEIPEGSDAIAVCPLALEGQFNQQLKDGITTKEIQETLIRLSLEMCCPESPEWRLVAARLVIWGRYKDVKVARGFGYYLDEKIIPFSKPKASTSYALWVKNQLTNQRFNAKKNQWEKHPLYDFRLKEYTPEQLSEAGSWIVPERDKDYDIAGMNLWVKRYLLPNELPQEAILTASLLLALPEKPDKRMEIARQFYDAISLRKLSLATPILANLRVPKGNLTSCFIVKVDDSLASIFHEITNAAQISKGGGGVGVNLSRVRASGSWVGGHKKASGGVVPWVKLFNDTGVAVNQLGKRSGAITVGIDSWHLDILEFLELQTENGDQRRKAYDIFPQIICSDEFMRRVQKEEKWTLVDPYEIRDSLGIELADLWGEEFESAYQLIESELNSDLNPKGKITLYNRISARELFKSIMRSQIETGMPYLCFKDAINRANPNKHEGMIPQVNLCVESFSNVATGKTAHCCNLTSLNMANINFDEIGYYCDLSVRLLDNTIELTTPPIQEAANHNNRYRTIGVGVMGWADYLARNEKKYSDLEETSQVFEEIAYHCTNASMELSKERGAFSAFEGSEWGEGNLGAILPGVQLRLQEETNRWHQLKADIMRFGIRNSHIIAIAPNTSSSKLQGCTASILPTYQRFFYDKAGKGFDPISVAFPEYWWHYQENHRLEQIHVVNAVSTMQKWVDTGISMELTYNLNQGVYWADKPEKSITAKNVFETELTAWKQGCKSIYYTRTIQKDSFKESSECVSCAN